MRTQHARRFSRRKFLGELTLGGMAGVLGLHHRPVAAEPPPETATVRLIEQLGGICLAPQYLAKEFLRSEGFTDVHYAQVKPGASIYEVLASGEADISMAFGAPVILRIDTGQPLVLLSGLHVGCLELFGNERVRTIRDLKGKTVVIPGLGSANHIFLASMAAYVGVDPNKEINWVTDIAVRPPAEWARRLAEGQFDAIIAAPPRSLAFRAQGVGHVVVNMTTDRPWSQYFCCMVVGHRDFVRQHPVATKRVLRALLKAADLCTQEPGRAARFLLDKGYTKEYDRFLLDSSAATQYAFALQAIKEIPYARWREYDPEDTVRFFALRLHEIGMITSSPQKIIARGTDWRFLNELKKELKG
jgi:NitT/TauT family transport system substrate-binding protein